MVTELVTNAGAHAGGPVETRLLREPGPIRIEADDHGNGKAHRDHRIGAGAPVAAGCSPRQRHFLDRGVTRPSEATGKTVRQVTGPP